MDKHKGENKEMAIKTPETIYKYEYTFENGLEISEASISYEPNHVYLSINRHGDCIYCMYSDNPHMEETFFKGISDLLSQDMTSAHNLYQIAYGRFHKFDKFWKKFNEKKHCNSEYDER